MPLVEWLSDRKKRALQKKNVDVRRRIELIQDFDMPTVSTKIKVSRDGQYIMAAGTYKPRIRCFDTYQLSLKFERCLDSEVVTFDILSDDYSKIVFLQCDRYVEFHSQHGRYYRTRIPKFGRDFSYHYPSCDLYFVGARENNVCDINPIHCLFATGTAEGKVECWDPRTRNRVGVLDCALSSVTADTEIDGLPSISALKFNGALNMAVGTSTGQVLLYDLRSSNPLIVKDHQYGLPIKSIQFQDPLDLIISADSRIVKMWNKDTGKIFTSMEPEHDINDVCLYPNSGMLLTANEDPKMNIYYIPRSDPVPPVRSMLELFGDSETAWFPVLMGSACASELRALSRAVTTEHSGIAPGGQYRQIASTVLQIRPSKADFSANPLIGVEKTLGDRLKLEEKLGTLSVSDTTVGSKQMTFKLKKELFRVKPLACVIKEVRLNNHSVVPADVIYESEYDTG
ncbi:Nucleolar protein 10 [Chelonia mydas]|uniref:Nucleolar protein 10 n=1 Tax=Chelonia mydas TaxID=8469 RepID=M7CBD0_CHEMY|nr:Nucleolar protein 10 [Chelonia mydas]